MKTILLYNPYWRSFGGGEKYLLTLGQVLSGIPNVRVTILSRDPTIQKSALEQYFHLDLSPIELRQIACGPTDLRSETGDADVLVTLSNFQYVRNSARRHVEVLQIPYGPITPGTMFGRLLRGEAKEFVKDFKRLYLLKMARERATLVLVYSEFVASTLQRNFSVPCTVLPPPIQDFYQAGIPKKKVILSVGRFFSGLYNNKRYDILTEAFRSADKERLAGWEYHIAGSAGKDPETQKFIQTLRDQNAGFPVFLHTNEPYETMRTLFNEASMFWHAAGFGVDETIHPENSEHFGMTTVEAMSAGCIPLVINRGGQREIISEGKDGFLWESIPELLQKSYNVAGAMDGDLSMADAARSRYRQFDIRAFSEKCIGLFAPILG